MYNNLIEVIASKREVTKKGIYFIQSEGKEEYLSYSELYISAWKLKECMIQSGIAAGTEVILQQSDNRSFLIAFWACVIGRMLPVPLSAQRGKESIERVLKIYRELKNPYIITNNARMEEIEQYAVEQKIRKPHFFLQTKTFEQYEYTEQSVLCKPDDIAFLQFSSGSTGEPKGVVVTHFNLMENFKGMIRSSEIKETDSMLSWMPLYHNLGLIVSHLLGIVCNLNSYLMSTDLFIYQPHLWMDKASEHKVTLTCSPNFGYRYYLHGIMNRDCSELDLSHLRIILNGAEPISLKACNTFLEMMKPYGLREDVFQTGYGLAEATVSVTSTFLGRNLEIVNISGENQKIGSPVRFLNTSHADEYAVELVKVGRPHFNTSIRIADDKGNALEEDYFGQIQVKGPIVTNGYYQGLQQEHKMVLHDGWLDTGDIGFLHEGQLIISGRKKDIIFVNGKNYFCHDLEGIIREEHPNCECAICGIFQKELERDQIVLFLVKGDQTFLEIRKFGENLRKRITKRTGIVIDKIVLVQEIPKTGSGKIQRFQLKEYFKKGLYDDLYKQYTRTQVMDIIQEQVKQVLGFEMEDQDESLVESGLNSMKAATFQKLLTQVFQMEIPVSIAYDYPSVNAVADFILGKKEEKKPKQKKPAKAFEKDDIAVIGMSCQFPNGADSLDEYWTKLLAGYDAITEIPDERKELKAFFEKENVKMYGGFLNDIDQFDSSQFGITPKEAKYLDPQQRLLLQNSYLALCDACLNIRRLRGSRTGVFLGISNSEYKEIMPQKEVVAYMLTGNMNNMAAGRISYTFDFQGPSMVVDTACSSSLTAVHQAVLSLRLGESDMALAGGANCILSSSGYLGLKEMNALSPTGRCHTFDEGADGYVRSEGCGVVVLKRYQDARKNGDRIYAVIKGSALNNDGWSSGLTAPNGSAQVKVMRLALEDAGVEPSEVSYIETHGTGTKLGDPQEVNALNRVYGNTKEPIVLGAVKTNIGHTESAAGIASFIKAVFAVSTGKIPGNQGIRNLNHLIPWDSMRFQVPQETVLWNDDKRTAAISAFGLSGTNVHMIVQQKEEEKKSFEDDTPCILTLSSRKKELLIRDMHNMEVFLDKTPSSLKNVLQTLNRCRADEKYRIGIAAKTREEYRKILKEKEEAFEGAVQKKTNETRKIVLLCGGIQKLLKQEVQNLYEHNRVFQKAFETCDEIVRKKWDVSLLKSFSNEEEWKDRLYIRMSVEYGIYKVLQFFGIVPDIVLGHGNGEWIGAVIAGIITLEQAFGFALYMEQVKEKFGQKRKTALVFLSEDEFQQRCRLEKPHDIFVVSVNTAESIVVAYQDEKEFQKFIRSQGVSCVKLDDYEVTWIEEKEEAIEEFLRLTEAETISNGTILYFSTTAGLAERIMGDRKRIFTSQLDKTAQILTTIQETERMEGNFYLECNVRPYLSALTAQDLLNEQEILPVIRKQGNEELQMREAIAKMYELGIDIHFSSEDVQGDWLVKLPKRESNKKSYWF